MTMEKEERKPIEIVCPHCGRTTTVVCRCRVQKGPKSRGVEVVDMFAMDEDEGSRS